MKTKTLSAMPFLLIGFLFLLLFGMVTWGVLFDSSWVTAFDIAWIDRIQSFVSEGTTSFIMKATELGNIKLIILLTVISVIILFIMKRYAEGLWLGGTMLLCGAVAVKILKAVIDRDRPEILQIVTKTNESFPSGHSVGTTIFLGLIALIAVLSQVKMWKKWVISLLSLALIFFIFATRIYLGVHFPTDVIGGFFFGMASLWISAGFYILFREPLREFLKKMKLHDKSTAFVRERSR